MNNTFMTKIASGQIIQNKEGGQGTFQFVNFYFYLL